MKNKILRRFAVFLCAAVTAVCCVGCLGNQNENSTSLESSGQQSQQEKQLIFYNTDYTYVISQKEEDPNIDYEILCEKVVLFFSENGTVKASNLQQIKSVYTLIEGGIEKKEKQVYWNTSHRYGWYFVADYKKGETDVVNDNFTEKNCWKIFIATPHVSRYTGEMSWDGISLVISEDGKTLTAEEDENTIFTLAE